MKPFLSKFWVLDVDGCLIRTARPGGAGGTAMSHAGDLVRSLKAAGRTVVVCTNASQRPPEEYASHLRDLGIDIANEEFVTAGSAAADYIAAQHPTARVLVVGSEGVSEPLRRHGITVIEPSDSALADIVVCGAADLYTTQMINAACLAVDNGAQLYSTHLSPWFHGGCGKSVAITAAITAAISWTTGASAQVLGKPSSTLAAMLVERFGGDGTAVTVVGDATAEIQLARHMNANSITVLSGALMPEEVAQLEHKPDLVVEDVAMLFERMRETLNRP